MNSSTTLLFETETEAEKLIGVGGVCNRGCLHGQKAFLSGQGTCVPLETSATNRLKCSRNSGVAEPKNSGSMVEA